MPGNSETPPAAEAAAPLTHARFIIEVDMTTFPWPVRINGPDVAEAYPLWDYVGAELSRWATRAWAQRGQPASGMLWTPPPGPALVS